MCLQKNPVEHLCNEPLDISILSNSDDVSLYKAVSCPTENSNLSVPVVTDAASLSMKSCEAETTEDVMAISREPQMLPGTNNNSGSNIVDLYSDKFSGAADVSEKGSALVLDDEYLDDDYIYQITVAFGKSAPPEPVYKLPRQVIIVKRDRRNYQCYDERGKNG